MTFLIANAKTRLGILPADTTKDAFLQSSLDVALSFAETYCDRWFMKQDETEVLTHDNGVISLHRYPLEVVTAVQGDSSALVGYEIDKPSGLIYTHGYGSHVATVTYRGGYATLPVDLEFALWAIFDAVWASTPGGGGSVGSSGGGGGAIESVSIADVGTVKFSSSGSAGVSAGGGSAFGGMIPASARAILDLYRREVC